MLKLKHIMLLESPQTDVADLENKIKDVDIKKIENTKKIYKELMSMLMGRKYSETIEYIDEIIKDKKLRFILSLGFGGKLSDTDVKLNKTTIRAYQLIPTQNEIGLDETLKYLMIGEHIDDCFKSTVMVKKPIVTFQKTFIIDGHHRWSEIYATNPNANLECIDISCKLSPIAMLKAVQATIGSNIGKLITKDVEGKNLLKCSRKELERYVSNCPESTIDKLRKYYDDPLKQIVDNCLELQENNTPILNAPKRGEMPQTSKDPNLFSDLGKGVSKL